MNIRKDIPVRSKLESRSRPVPHSLFSVLNVFRV